MKQRLHAEYALPKTRDVSGCLVAEATNGPLYSMVNQRAKYRMTLSYLKLRKSPTRERSRLKPRQLLFGRRNVGARSNLDSVFSALSDPTRRAMLERLSQGEASVTELANPFDISLPAISKHLHVLESAGLLTREREGRTHRLHLDPTPLISTAAWIDHYRPLWQTQLEALSTYLEQGQNKQKP